MYKTVLNLNQRYLEIANLNLLHDFYFDQLIPLIEIFPLPQTQIFLNNHRLILKQIDSSIIILQEGKYNKSNWIPKISISKKQSLFFGIKFNDSLFQVKSNIPFHTSKDQKFFLKVNEDQDLSYDEELSIYPYLSQAFNDDDLRRLSVKNVIYKTSNNKDELPIDGFNLFQKHNPGIYKLQYEDESEYSFIFSNYDNLFDGFISFSVEQSAQNIFNYKFNNRKIYWEYILVSNQLTSLEECQIIDDKNEIEFTFSENLENNSGSVFISSNPIPLKEKYLNSLSLEKHGEKLLNLPFPKLKNLKIKIDNVKNSVNKYFLSTYVNL